MSAAIATTDASLPAGAPEDAALHASMLSLKPLLDALACISAPSRAEDVLLSHSMRGLRFSTAAPAYTASVILPPSTFTRLHVAQSQLNIRLNLSALRDALGVLGATATHVELWFVDTKLVARSELHGSVVHISLAALHYSEPPVLIEPADAPELAAFILGAEAFRDVLQDLDYAGSQLVQLLFLADPPCLRLVSPAGSSEQQARLTIELSESAAGFQALRCDEEQSVVLAGDLLLRPARALAAAESVKLALNQEHVLSVVCRLRGVGTEERSFVEFALLTQQCEGDGEEEPL
eukprot:TRINITY_DN854_c0_g1_i1.p1 TRINITY_DN854_c0_g1~~TRINITY_DN854_c0_g1_i1.p1  ORF type:complete len:293 (-),score=64.30 TRINITY_DN854_c0_g1_i1:219-1097(-)